MTDGIAEKGSYGENLVNEPDRENKQLHPHNITPSGINPQVPVIVPQGSSATRLPQGIIPSHLTMSQSYHPASSPMVYFLPQQNPYTIAAQSVPQAQFITSPAAHGQRPPPLLSLYTPYVHAQENDHESYRDREDNSPATTSGSLSRHSSVSSEPPLSASSNMSEDIPSLTPLSVNSPNSSSVSNSLPSPISPSISNQVSGQREPLSSCPDITHAGELVCVICKDRATGHHYGVTSCEGCKGFFKRTVQNKKVYTCRNLSQDCQIDKRQRNRCQFCRFQKCLQAGMLKEAVREDRTPGGKHKNHYNLANKLKVAQSLPPKPTIPTLITELMRIESSDNNINTKCNSQPEGEGNQDKELLGHIVHLADKQLLNTVEWLQKITFFSTINSSDRATLVKNSWLELLMLNLARRSMAHENLVMLCNGQLVDVATAEPLGIGDIIHRVTQLTSKLKELKLDQAEYVCLKIIILLNPDIKGLRDQQLVEKLQDNVHTAMQEYTSHFYPDQPTRFGNILLRLPELRSISTKGMERLFVLNITGNISVNNVLSDLLLGAST